MSWLDGDDGRGGDRLARSAALHAPFTARRARAACWVVGPVAVVGAVALVLLTRGDVPLVDDVGILAVGAALALLCWAQGGVRAVPGPDGLEVRNLLRRRHLDWAQVLAVHFGRDHSWAVLDLADGTTWPVMALQHADGDRGASEARRLATLVELHGRTR